MPLQNRVTPFGEIVAVPERGLFTGNRGIIHDPATRTLLNAVRFRDAWAAGNGIPRPLAPVMDATLHAERLEHRAKRLHPLPRPIGDLPDGTMVAAGGEAHLVAGGRLLRWSPAGYRPADPLPICEAMITPPSTVAALAAGYRPVLHPSAAASGNGS